MPTVGLVAAAVLIFYGVIAAYVIAMAAVARLCGVRTTGVWVGYGPTLWSRETRFGRLSLGVLPLGGAVSFAGEDEQGDSEPPDGFRTAPAWVRAAIIVSGPLASLLVGVALLTVPVVLAAPQLAVGGTGRAVPDSSLGPLAVEDRATTPAGQWELAERTAGEILWRLLTFETLEAYGGWVGGFYTAGRAGAESWPALLSLMGVAAVANGVVNLLPLPTLNGFHLVWIGVEAVAGRRLAARIQPPLLVAGTALALVFFVRLVIADIHWLRAVL